MHIPAERAIMEGGCRSRKRLKVAGEHLSQIVMEIRWVPWRVLRVSKVILFQGGVGRSLIEKGLNSAVNVSHEYIFFPLCNVSRDPNGKFLTLPSVQARAKKFEGAESCKTETGDVRDILWVRHSWGVRPVPQTSGGVPP